jgi:hypothetical protein
VPRTQRHARRRRPRPPLRPYLEGLESRCLLSSPGSLSADAIFHETLDQALDLTSLAPGSQLTANGVIGAGPHGAADVNWYEFELSATAEVRLTTAPGPAGQPLAATLSLYNDAPVGAYGPIDPYTPDGHRLLAQDDAGAQPGPATLDRLLGPGNYWVAVSGSGNDYFYPFLAGSGYDGRTGSYQLSLTASDPGPAYDDLTVPVALAADPAPNAVLGSSPFVLRFDLNAPIDPSSVVVGSDPSDTAQLWFNTTNDFTPGGSATQVDLSAAWVSLEQNADGNDNELQIALASPLPAGYYQAVLQGYGPGGSDYVVPFRIAGPVGNTDPSQQPGDSVDTAVDLPHVDDGRLHQVAGAIGVDPTDPFGFNPSAVQFYRFSINGPGLYAFGAEAFAGRIGSPLDPALTLYRVDAFGELVFVASNGDTGDLTPSPDGRYPLAKDAALLLSLPRGRYVLAVSSYLNYPDPLEPDRAGVFNPYLPQSASAGYSTGPYVLNLLVQPAGPAPHVVSVVPDRGPTGDGPLTGVRVRFSQPVNLLPLAFQAFQDSLAQTGSPNGALSSVALTDALGRQYDLRLESYDDTTNTAAFVLLDGVPPGTYTLHLSGRGPQAITSPSGTPLAGNGPGGTEFTASFAITGAPGDATSWASLPGFDSTQHPQPIGVLFPGQLSGGITITRDASAGANATEQDYSFQLLQAREYSFAVSGHSLPPGLALNVLDASGAVVGSYTYSRRHPSASFFLAPGTYTLRVSGSSGVGAYSVRLSVPGSPENPMPLVVGSGPALRARLLTNAPDTAPPPLLSAASTPAPGPVTPASAGGPLGMAGLLTLPSSPLIAQAFSPLSGVAAPGGAGADGGSRLIVQAPAPGGLENLLLGVLIGTQPPLPDAAEPPAPSLAGGQSAAPVDLNTALRVVDVFFESWGWFALPAPVPTPTPDTAPTTPPAEEDGATGGEGLGAAIPAADRHAPADGDPAPWVVALAAGAALIPQRRRRRSGRIGLVDPVLPRER